MRRLLLLVVALLCLAASPAWGQTPAYEEVVLDEEVAAPEPVVAAIAAYGPFRVIDGTRAALVDVTDAGSPAAFAAMLGDYPGIAELHFIECPGTFDDQANLRLGRMIRARGIETRVPGNGSVRSGAVELFLAGARRTIDEGAEFAVHAWLDEDGRQARDYPASAPENRKYLAYYREMGMSAAQADAFYAMTNSVPFESARWLDATQMRRWISTGAPGVAGGPVRLAALDSPAGLQ